MVIKQFGGSNQSLVCGKMRNKMINLGYFSDMKIIDERLTKLEKDYDKVTKLLKRLISKLSEISGKYNEEK